MHSFFWKNSKWLNYFRKKPLLLIFDNVLNTRLFNTLFDYLQKSSFQIVAKLDDDNTFGSFLEFFLMLLGWLVDWIYTEFFQHVHIIYFCDSQEQFPSYSLI